MAQNLLNRVLINNALKKTGHYHYGVSSSIVRFSSQKAQGFVEKEGNLKKNPYYSKYEGKIQTLKQGKPNDYLSRMEEADARRKSEEVIDRISPKELLDRRSSKKEGPGGNSSAKEQRSVFLQAKKLEDIVKLDLLETKTPKEIAHIWKEFHKNVDGLSSVLDGEVWSVFSSRSKRYPVFLLPLPRKDGYEFVVSQTDSQVNRVDMIQLALWQEMKGAAPPCLSLFYYPELVEEKGLALMRGSYDPQRLSLLEAQCLSNTLHLYYAENDFRRTALLDRFTHDPESFQHMDLIAELEQLGL